MIGPERPIDASLDGVTIHAFPYYPNNPWQQLMYREALARGAVLATYSSLEEFASQADALDGSSVIHVNWTGPVSQLASDVIDATARVESFVGALERARSRAARIVWTIHNTLPHELRFRLPELLLLRELARRADAVVVMSPSTAEEVRDYVHLDLARVIEIPHPSYVGVYPDEVSPSEARASLGFGDDDIVAVAFGVIRPYKNIELLARSVRIARAREPRLRLAVAGEIGYGTDRDSLLAVLGGDGIVCMPERVQESDVQSWMRSADFAVFPFARALNTGSVMLAATFGVPALIADLPSLRWIEGDWVLRMGRPLSEDVVADSLLVAVERFVGSSSRAAGSAAREFAESCEPGTVSRRFADLVAELHA